MSDAETENKESSWSDRLKQHIKPEWMVERDKKRPPGKADWRPGHLLWVMTLGSPAEIDALFSKKQTDMDAALKQPGDRVKTNWQERESNRRGNSAKENADGWAR